MKTQTFQKRIGWIDISKAFAIVLIVLGHTLKFGTVHNIVYYVHVPVFFLLSGITVKTDSPLRRICTDLKRIMIPYLVFGIISIAVYAFFGEFAASGLGESFSDSAWKNLCQLAYGSARGKALKFNRPLWFLPALFATKLLFYLVHSCCKGKNGPLVIASVLGSTFSFWYTAHDFVPLPLSLELSLKMLPFFVAGRVLADAIIAEGENYGRKSVHLGLGVLLVLAVCAAGVYAPQINYTNHMIPSAFLFYGIGYLGCCGLCLLAMGIQQCKPMEYLGKKSVSVLVMHKFPIVFLQTIGPFRGPLKDPDTAEAFWIGALPVTLITIASCMIAGHIIEHFAPEILGQQRRAAAVHQRRLSKTDVY